MKTITTTREYDAEGRLVKEVICEVVTNDAPVLPVVPGAYCTCGTSGICAIHGSGRGWWQSPITCISHLTPNTAASITTNAASLV